MRGLFGATRRLLGGGGVLHPDTTKGGRRPGQLFPHTIAQVNFLEWAFIGSCLIFTSWSWGIYYLRYYALNNSPWIDDHYDRTNAAYEKSWYATYRRKYQHNHIH
eukprot:Hpha_TRINITY_DN30335_c0_g1::TRINITY_DN30335_c0_g1_i1::g.147094::m.147094